MKSVVLHKCCFSQSLLCQHCWSSTSNPNVSKCWCWKSKPRWKIELHSFSIIRNRTPAIRSELTGLLMVWNKTESNSALLGCVGSAMITAVKSSLQLYKKKIPKWNSKSHRGSQYIEYDDAGFYNASACYNHILSNNFFVYA